MIKPVFTASVVALAVALHAVPANAQSTQERAERSTYDGDIVVTARRVAERLQDIPVAVTALSGVELQRKGVREIADLSNRAPNLSMRPAINDQSGVTVILRGQSEVEVLLTADPAVGLYIDNIVLPRSIGLRGGMLDVQRVEVLRGPQGTLYGKNTTGGAINVITNDPVDERGASFKLGYGSRNTVTASAVLNTPITDTISVRIAGAREKGDGFGKNFDGGENQDLDNATLRGKLRFASGNFSAVAMAEHQHYDTNGTSGRLTSLSPAVGTQPLGGLLTLQTAAERFGAINPTTIGQAITLLNGIIADTDYGSSAAIGQISRVNMDRAGLDMQYELSDVVSIRSISGYQKLRRKAIVDSEGTPFEVLRTTLDTRSKFWSQELQLLGKTETLDWVGGVYYSRETGNEGFQSLVAPNVINSQIFGDGDVRNVSKAVFGQANWQFAENFSLTGGLRYTEESKRLVSRNAAGGGVCAVPVSLRDTPAICQATLENSFNRLSWLASIDRKFDDILVYAKVSRGFRGGGQNLRGTTVATFTPFKPETITEYEVGVKSEFWDRRARLNIAAFYDTYKEIQRSISVFDTALNRPATVVTNAARARIAGIEVEGMLRPVDGLSFEATVGYLDPKYKSFVDLTGDRSDEPWPAPDWTYSLTARYTATMSSGEISAELSYAGQSKLSFQPTASNQTLVTQKGYGLLNGRISLVHDDTGLEFALFGRNITNKKYIRGAGSLQDTLGFQTVFDGEPRTIGVQVSARFGGER